MSSNFKRLLSIFLLASFACFFSACEEEVESGIVSSRAGIENLTFDSDGSDATSIAAFWDVDKAIAAGATAFNIQLVNAKGGDNYSYDKQDGKAFTSCMLLSSEIPNDEYVFKGLEKGTQYFLRGRAVYPGSIFSEWLYVTSDTGIPAVIEVGVGLVNVLDAPVQNLNIQPLDKKIRLSWTAKLGVDGYKVSWKLAGAEDWTSVITTDNDFTIDDLDPETDYQINVVAIRDSDSSPDNLVAVKTLVEINSAQIRVKTSNSYGGVFTGITPVGVGLEFSVSNFENIALDASQAYTVGVYTDEACGNLVYSFDFEPNGANCSNGSSTTYRLWGSDLDPTSSTNVLAHPGFFFSGLKPSTDYWFKVDVKDRENINAVIAVRTADDLTVLPLATKKAEIGEYALYEQFNDLIWGGETSMKLPSFSTTKRGTLTAFEAPVGAMSSALVNNGFYICVPSQDIGLFSTMGKAIKGSAHITDWRQWTSDGNQGRMLARNGFIRAGNSSARGFIITPELSSLKAPATIEVSVDFFIDGNLETGNVGFTIQTVKDAVFSDPTSLGISYQVTSAVFGEVYTDDIERNHSWQTVTVQMNNVYPNARLGFGASEDKKAINIDNIRVKVISYADVTNQEPVSGLEAINVTDNSAKLTWAEPYGANSYNIRYKAEGASWTEISDVTGKEYLLSDLLGSTRYTAEVQAVGTGMVSEWVAVEFETLAEVRKLSFKFAAENLAFTKVEITSFEKTKLFGESTVLACETPIDLADGKAVAEFPVDEFSVTKGLLMTAYKADGSKLYRVVWADGAKEVKGSESVSLNKWLAGGVSSAAELMELSRLVNSHPERSKGEFCENQLARFTDENGWVVLLEDIDLAGCNFEPIGISEAAPFVGLFDGRGHTIKNMVQDFRGTVQYTVGLFGVLNFEGIIKNVNLDSSCHIKFIRTAGMARVGSVVCFVQGSPYNAVDLGAGCSVQNVSSNATIEISSEASQQFVVGGIAGCARGGLNDCSFGGKIVIEGDSAAPSSASMIGGVAGQYAYSYISKGFEATNCSFTGTLEYNMSAAAGAVIGGVFGNITAADLSGMTFTGVVKVPHVDVKLGGIAGTVADYGKKNDLGDEDHLSSSKAAGKLIFSASQGANLGVVFATTAALKKQKVSNIVLGGSFGTSESALTKLSESTVQKDWTKTWASDQSAIPFANTSAAADEGALYASFLSAVSYE